MEYTRKQIIDRCRAELELLNTFYQANVANYLGKTIDTGEMYTEVVAEFVLDNIDSFRNGIQQITRSAPYKTESHDGIYSSSSNRIEEIMAMQMYNYCKDGKEYDYIGRIIDYQTPLKSKQADTAGKIDLLAYDGETLRLLELKKRDSKETMLRCVLEVYTYSKTVDIVKLLWDFKLPNDSPIEACPFVFKGGSQWLDMNEDRMQLKKLMTELSIKPYYITEIGNEFRIEEQ